MTTLSKDGHTALYGYDGNGRRTRRTDLSGNTYRYMWDMNRICGMERNGQTIQFIYDQDGTPFGFRTVDRMFYYLLDIHGDVIGILDENGQQVVSYQYDVWGNLLSMSDNTGLLAIGSLNPLRYRGYCWDEDTGLYYLVSRYYIPQMGRFLNADDPSVLTRELDTFSEKNLYVYCENDPVNNFDSDGTVAFACAAASFVIAAGSTIMSSLITGQGCNVETLVDAAANGLIAFGCAYISSAIWAPIAGAVASGIYAGIKEFSEGEKNPGKLVNKAVKSAGVSLLNGTAWMGKFYYNQDLPSLAVSATYGFCYDLIINAIGAASKSKSSTSKSNTSQNTKSKTSTTARTNSNTAKKTVSYSKKPLSLETRRNVVESVI